jgi:epsilon-lactone hydrolase
MPSPQLDMIVQALRARPQPAGDVSIAEMRAGMEQMAAISKAPEGTRVEPVNAGGVPSEWSVAPDASEDVTILYLHGGGYALGSLSSHRHFVGWLSKAAGARVLAADYRLAPEHPYPAAVEDAVAAYRWLLASGVAPARITLAGDSAGGGLALATLVALRDAGIPLPAAAALMSPWVDLALAGESMDSKAEIDPMVTREPLAKMAEAYLAGQSATAPTASPLYADLAGLPPLLIHVGTAETLLDDSLRLADRAKAAGVDVQLEVFDDLIHVFHWFAPLLPEAVEATEQVGKFLRGRM